MDWNTQEKARYYLEALEQLKDMLKDFDYDEDWGHANTTARCLAWLSGNASWFAVADEYWKKQQQKETKEDATKKGDHKMTATCIYSATIQEPSGDIREITFSTQEELEEYIGTCNKQVLFTRTNLEGIPYHRELAFPSEWLQSQVNEQVAKLSRKAAANFVAIDRNVYEVLQFENRRLKQQLAKARFALAEISECDCMNDVMSILEEYNRDDERN